MLSPIPYLFELSSQASQLSIETVLLTGMRQEAISKLFIPPTALTPTNINDGVGAMGDGHPSP